MIYISDLDGTLLNDNAMLSDFTIDTIRKLNESGIKFTIATARSYYTARSLIEQLDLKYPCILRNGSMIIDPVSKKTIYSKMMDYQLGVDIINDLKKFNLNPIVHCHIDDQEYVEYMSIENEGEAYYINSRLESHDKRLRKVNSYQYHDNCSFVSICSIQTGHENHFDLLSDKYNDQCVIHTYKDSYSGFSWLEFNYIGASKKTASEYLVNYLNEDGYIAFGDASNDLDMLKHAKKAYIPAQSYLHLSGYPFDLIENNNKDGVCRYLADRHLK
ncbi:MAG: HAD family phosphatase [Clostridia bacterium]|nr:HAD family phosphatase [Clostridia bacterium]